MLGHYDAKYDTTLRIFKGWCNRKHFTHFRNPSNDNLYVRYGYWKKGRVVSNYNWLDNDWNGNNPAASATLFISPSSL